MRARAWYCTPLYARVAFRGWNSPDYRDFNLGVRLARTIP